MVIPELLPPAPNMATTTPNLMKGKETKGVSERQEQVWDKTEGRS